jgi:putative transposase
LPQQQDRLAATVCKLYRHLSGGGRWGRWPLTFQRRQMAVLMYAEGVPFKEITLASGISEQETRRHVGRCVMATVDGPIIGFYALIPGWRIKAYNRTARIAHTAGGGSGGCSGALTQLFEKFPEVRDYIKGRFLQLPGTRKLKTTRISYIDLHGEFLDELRALHIGENDWPFNTDDCGYQSLRRYCHSLLDSDQHLYIKARSGIEAQRRGRIGTGEHSVFPRMHGFGCCQLDFHKIDALCTILLENEEGVMIPILLPRFHVGVLIEERWGLVLGAFIALEMTPSGDSVLEVIDCAMRPFPIEPGEPRTQLVDLAGVFPNQMLPLLQYQCFSVLKMDNAWSNAAGDVVTNIIDTIGCAINFGPVKQWWRRGLVESFFDALSARGMKRLPSTVGAHPKDTSKDEPGKNAVRFKIAVRDIITVIHGCIRDHNETRSEKCGFASPLEACMAAMENPDSGMMFQPIPQPRKDDLRLMRMMKVVTVRGNAGKHERPHVRLGRWR